MGSREPCFSDKGDVPPEGQVVLLSRVSRIRETSHRRDRLYCCLTEGKGGGLTASRFQGFDGWTPAYVADRRRDCLTGHCAWPRQTASHPEARYGGSSCPYWSGWALYGWFDPWFLTLGYVLDRVDGPQRLPRFMARDAWRIICLSKSINLIALYLSFWETFCVGFLR
jgi:hypothetical protein